VRDVIADFLLEALPYALGGNGIEVAGGKNLVNDGGVGGGNLWRKFYGNFGQFGCMRRGCGWGMSYPLSWWLVFGRTTRWEQQRKATAVGRRKLQGGALMAARRK